MQTLSGTHWIRAIALLLTMAIVYKRCLPETSFVSPLHIITIASTVIATTRTFTMNTAATISNITVNLTPSSTYHHTWPLPCPPFFSLLRHDDQGEGYALVRTITGTSDLSGLPDAPAVSTTSEEDGLPDTSASHTSKEMEKQKDKDTEKLFEREREREKGEDSILNPLLQTPQEQELGTLAVPLSLAVSADRPVTAEWRGFEGPRSSVRHSTSHMRAVSSKL
jgi:hypothetical protein